jgi:hypothetical protein
VIVKSEVAANATKQLLKMIFFMFPQLIASYTRDVLLGAIEYFIHVKIDRAVSVGAYLTLIFAGNTAL